MEYPFSYRWQFISKSVPEQLWPLLSDTNRLFKDMGQLPVQHASISHNVPKGHKELTYEQIHKTDIWEEEPYEWEAPFHLKVRRNYKSGTYKSLLFSFDIAQHTNGSKVTFRFSGEAKNFSSSLRIKRNFSSSFKRRLNKIVHFYDSIISSSETNVFKKHPFRLIKKPNWNHLKNDLIQLSSDSSLSGKLIKLLRQSDDLDLEAINPIFLAKKWNEPLYKVLDVLFFATNLKILNLQWQVACTTCRQTQKNIRKISEITDSLYCSYCKKEFELDFHNSINLVFQPHPLVRKLDVKEYCKSSPAQRSHVKLHQYVYPGQKRFVKVHLDPGNYKIYCEQTDSTVLATVQNDGLENATLTFNNRDSQDQHVTLSTDPNLVIHNQTGERIFVIIEDLDLKKYSVSASEITSQQLFRNLFPNELLQNEQQFKCEDMTVMFTDLTDSSSMYSNNGDEFATGQVIDHFEVLRKIISEERGAIVKTIGDATMSIFQEPVDAVRAFHRAQQHFKEAQNSDYKIQLKGGIHYGNGIAVTLNNRIDFFGKTINIASRLVENAGSEQLVISSDAYKNRNLELFLNAYKDEIRVKHFDVTLKGAEEKTFEARCLSMNNSSLRLVV
ncbi:MAG: adenylate/guanylate cyclase domain-containing protein [Balneolaceae bacterium]